MSTLTVLGGKELQGTISVKGAKNHALKVFAVSLLVDGDLTVRNVPNISDVDVELRILQELGATVERDVAAHTVKINAQRVSSPQLSPQLMKELRAAVVVSGALLNRFGSVFVPHPGGDLIGKRPIDIFIEGYETLGAHVEYENGGYAISTPQGLTGAEFVMRRVSVTATEALVLAALGAKGVTTLVNVAMEPEVVALCENLVSLGARIEGIGTHTLRVYESGVLRAGEITVVPDRLETGTFAIMGSILSPSLKITDCDPSVLHTLWRFLRVMGVTVDVGIDWVHVQKPDVLVAPFEAEIVTHEYPGFPTDLQAPLVVALTQAMGQTLVHETIYEGRLQYTEKLVKMGADIRMLDPHRVIVTGPTKLTGAKLETPDIRAGISLVMAGMLASGQTVIEHAFHIDRGYENIDERLRSIGADIHRT